MTFIVASLWVAPTRTDGVKWTLTVISIVLGILSAAGSIFGDDKLKGTTGVSMAVMSLALAGMPVRDTTDA